MEKRSMTYYQLVMPDGHTETVWNREDFLELVARYMGRDAEDYARENFK